MTRDEPRETLSITNREFGELNQVADGGGEDGQTAIVELMGEGEGSQDKAGEGLAKCAQSGQFGVK